MEDEKHPLLSSEHLQEMTANSREQSVDSNDETENSIQPMSFRIPMYGTYSTFSKTIPLDERLTFTWSDLNVFVNIETSAKKKLMRLNTKNNGDLSSTKKHIIKNVSGIAYPGELLAILGSSGAGKTTLLNALTFRLSHTQTVTGLRCVNNIPVTSKNLTSQSAYVQQDDLFIGSLTVKEHLVFQALLRMDKNISYEQRMRRVEEVLQELTLTHCENTTIGIPGRIKGISGGERKRLSFAAEVLTNPNLMFCDEPTSGLDSFMALNVIQVLKSLAQTGKTIICTIHQPSSELYAMFDKLLLMAEGRTAFIGSPEEADVFFNEICVPCPKNFNPADYFIQILAIVPGREEQCRNEISEICNKFEKSELGVRVAVEAASKGAPSSYQDNIWLTEEVKNGRYKTSWFGQFKAVLWRSWLSVIKEPLLIKVRLIQTTMVALLVGAIYFGQVLNQDGVMNINGALFIYLTNMTFQNVFAVINVFCSELPIFLREHRNGMYRTDVYFICKTIAELPLFIFIPVLFTSVSYFLVGLNYNLPSTFFVACGVVTLVANVSTSFGYLISCASTSVSMALSIGPPLIIPFLLFGGFFLNVNSIPIYFKWLSYLSWFRYGNEALMINQWQNITNIDCSTATSACPRTGHIVLETFNFSERVLKNLMPPQYRFIIYNKDLLQKVNEISRNVLYMFGPCNKSIAPPSYYNAVIAQYAKSAQSFPIELLRQNNLYIIQNIKLTFFQENFITDIIGLFMLIVVFRLLAFLALIIKTYRFA